MDCAEKKLNKLTQIKTNRKREKQGSFKIRYL